MEFLVVEEDGPDCAKYTLFDDVYDSIPSQRIAGLPNALLGMDSATGAIVVYSVDFLRSTSPGETIQVGLTRSSPLVRSSDFPGGSVGTYRATRIHPVVIR